MRHVLGRKLTKPCHLPHWYLKGINNPMIDRNDRTFTSSFFFNKQVTMYSFTYLVFQAMLRIINTMWLQWPALWWGKTVQSSPTLAYRFHSVTMERRLRSTPWSMNSCTNSKRSCTSAVNIASYKFSFYNKPTTQTTESFVLHDILIFKLITWSHWWQVMERTCDNLVFQ